MTAEKIFETRWAAALIEAALVRLRGELQAAGKRRLFDAVQGFLLGGEDASYQQVADALNLDASEAIKATIMEQATIPRRPCGRIWATMEV